MWPSRAQDVITFCTAFVKATVRGKNLKLLQLVFILIYDGKLKTHNLADGDLI